MRPVVAFVVDVVVVVIFVVLGRGSHDEGEAVTGTLKVVAPFLVALTAGWLCGGWLTGRRWWQQPLDLRFGVWLWGWTLVGGMLLRRLVFDRGTALAFVIVAALFLSLFLIGWRALAHRLRLMRVEHS